MTNADNARFDKLGNRMPATGHGCGCQMCADAHAAQNERMWLWSHVVDLVRNLVPDTSRPQAA